MTRPGSPLAPPKASGQSVRTPGPFTVPASLPPALEVTHGAATDGDRSAVIDAAAVELADHFRGLRSELDSDGVAWFPSSSGGVVGVEVGPWTYERHEIAGARSEPQPDPPVVDGPCPHCGRSWPPPPAAPSGRPGGRPRRVPEAVAGRVRSLVASGLSASQVAALLDGEGVPTAGGGAWTAMSVRWLLEREVV